MSEHLTNVTVAANDMAREIEQLKAELDGCKERLAHLEQDTLPLLHRKIEWQRDGKVRWRKRAVKAEAHVAELEATS